MPEALQRTAPDRGVTAPFAREAAPIEDDREWIYVFTVREGKLVSQEGFDERVDEPSAAGIEPA